MSTLYGGRGINPFPPFVKFLLFANGAIFLLLSGIGLRFGDVSLEVAVSQWFALHAIGDGFQLWQLVSYQYLHGGLGHIFFNMFALWMFGVELENLWGTRRFAVFYTLAGISAGLLHLLIPVLLGATGSTAIGASGSIMGVLLAFALLFPDRPILMFPIFFPIPARIFVFGYVAIDLIYGLMGSGDGVAHFAHLGGALGGFLLIKFGEPLMRWVDGLGSSTSGYQHRGGMMDVEYRDVEQPTYGRPPVTVRYETRQPQPERYRQPEPAATSTPTRFVVNGQNISQEQIDAILDKISQRGYHSLSDLEKQILFEVSRQL